jgi:hypothetical protein
MARSKTPPRPEPGHPEVSASQGIQLIDTQIAKADELLQNRPLKVDDYSTWELLTRNYLEKAFGRHSSNISSEGWKIMCMLCLRYPETIRSLTS